MIAANGAAAGTLEQKGFPSLRRVLRSPERWERIVALAESLWATRCRRRRAARRSRQFLSSSASGRPEQFPDLSLSVVKLLGRGEYVLELPGSRPRGTSVSRSATTPTRRRRTAASRTSSTQRLLKAALAGAPLPYSHDELAALAQHCTEQETNAAKVERQVLKSAAALLLASRIGERFDGARDRRLREGHLGPHRATPQRRERSCAASKGSTSASASGSSSSTPTSSGASSTSRGRGARERGTATPPPSAPVRIEPRPRSGRRRRPTPASDGCSRARTRAGTSCARRSASSPSASAGFRALHFVGPCVTVFGSARFDATHPYYALGEEVGARLAGIGHHGDDRRRSRA